MPSALTMLRSEKGSMKVLLIQQKMVGDVLASSVLCKNIKTLYPASEVHYLVHSHTAAVVENNPYVDKLLLFSPELRSDKLRFLKFLRWIRREKYDVVIDVYGKLESNLITAVSGSPVKISYRKWYTAFLYNHLYKHDTVRAGDAGLALENRLKLLEPLNPGNKVLDPKPRIFLKPEEKAQARNLLQKAGIAEQQSVIMIGILGSAPDKSYPLDYMAVIIDELAQRPDTMLLFNYLPSQQSQAEDLIQRCKPQSREKIALGLYTPSLRAFLGVLSQCTGLVANEGGAINMAKALDIPTFSIFSPWISKEVWDTFNQAPINRSVHLKDYLPEQINGKSMATLKSQSQELYRLFEPSLFLEELRDFTSNLSDPRQ